MHLTRNGKITALRLKSRILSLRRNGVKNAMDNKNVCKHALKDELGDLYCGNDKSENWGDFCVVCGKNYVPEGRQVCLNCEVRVSYEKSKGKIDNADI